MSDTKEDPAAGAPPPYPGPPAAGQYSGQQYSPYPPTSQPGQPYPPYPPTSQPGQQYPAYSQSSSQPGPYTTTTVVQSQPVNSAVIVRAGNCPNCRAGLLVEQFTCCGILCAIFFFPLGLICCLMMRRQVCTNCGAAY